MRTFITPRKGLVILIVVIGIVTGRQLAAVSSPAQDGTIYGCVETNSGRIRLIGAARGACLPSETPVSWNVQGPKGDTGASGPQGTQGVQGPPGTPADMTQVTSLQSAVATLQQQIATQGQQIGSLGQRVTTLENTWQDTNIDVNCGAGQTIAAALSQAARLTGRVTVIIAGVCTEAVTIGRSSTVLRGATAGDGLRGPTADSTVVRVVRGARDVTLSQLTVTGGKIGVRVGQGASVVLASSQVIGTGFHGVFVDGSVEIRQTTVDGAGGSGVFGWVGATVRMNNSVIQNSASRGLELQVNATAQVDGGSRLANNQGGAGLWFGAVLNLRDAIVENNRQDGVSASGGSTVLIGAGTVIRGNQFNGLRLGDTSVAGSFGPAELTGNGAWGVFCSGTPAVAQLTGALGLVSGNILGQSNCNR